MRASADAPPAPRLILITDSNRLVAGGTQRDRVRALVAQAREAFALGVDAVQLREPSLEGRALMEAAAAIASLGRLIVVERLDVALAAGAAGVHLRGDGVPLSRARALLPPHMSLSRAVHSAAEVAQAADADWILAGTVFPSASKPGREPLGLDGLRAIVRAAAVPVVAIGGITPASVREVRAAGASGVAVIGALLPPIAQTSVDSLRDRSLE